MKAAVWRTAGRTAYYDLSVRFDRVLRCSLLARALTVATPLASQGWCPLAPSCYRTASSFLRNAESSSDGLASLVRRPFR